MSGYRILYHHRIRSEDGQAVHVRELIRALRAAGHEVVECALVPKAVPATEARANSADAARNGGLWESLSLPRTAVEVLEILYARQGARMLTRAAGGFRPDFVYERHALHCDAGLRVARALGVPLLLEVNAPVCDEMTRLGLLRFRRRARRTERRVLGAADRVLSVTANLREMLLANGAPADRTVVIHNGVDVERFGPAAHAAGRVRRAGMGASEGTFVLGFVGYMRAWHRLEMAVEVLARDALREVEFWLVGEGPALADVLGRARELGVADRVRSIGEVDADEVAEWVCAFDAALIPAINDYASPLKLFDSYAAGVATIAPRQPNIEEVLRHGETGLLFEAGSVADLERQIVALVSDRELARRLGAAGRRAVVDEDWTWAGNARRVIAAYESVAGVPR